MNKIEFSEELWNTGDYECYDVRHDKSVKVIYILKNNFNPIVGITDDWMYPGDERTMLYGYVDLYLVKRPLIKELYINVYESAIGAYWSKDTADHPSHVSARKSCIKLTISEKGQFIKGENI